MKSYTGLLAGILIFLIYSHQSFGQVVAFPGAEGYGKNATGGRGGAVIEVVNLNDSGAGSLRAAIAQAGARTIVFRVSGTIYLNSVLKIVNGDVTIAGQTAPGDGITIANYALEVDADNVIIRYLRSRMGDLKAYEGDAFSMRFSNNVIVDHCSFSWSTDETASVYRNHNTTIQWCIISESLYSSVHLKGEHGYGGIWGGDKATFHHNLLAHHTSRNPRFNGARFETNWDELVDHRNNVIYNWAGNSAYGGDPSELDGAKARINIVNNYYKYGPATSTNVKRRIMEPYDFEGEYSLFYVDGNYIRGFETITDDNWDGGVSISGDLISDIKSDTPFPFDIDNTQSANDAYEYVMAGAGSIFPFRDEVDERIIYETTTGTATYGGSFSMFKKGIIDSQDDVGGFPTLESTPAPTDTDKDGMPDDWEDANGLDKNNAADRNDDGNENGYTNLEDYLNGLVSGFLIENMNPLFQPEGLSVLRDEEKKYITYLTWTDQSEGTAGFIIERSMGDKDNFVEIGTVNAGETEFTDFVTGQTEWTTVYYRVKAVSDSQESYYSDVVEIGVDVVTGLLDELKSQLQVYPNPVTDVLNIRMLEKENNFDRLEIVNLSGITVIQKSLENLNKRESFEINLSQLSKGVYIIGLMKNDGTWYRGKLQKM